MKSKKLLMTVIAVIVLFIPTIIGVVSYRTAQSSPVTKSSVTKMVLRTPKGNEYVFDKSAETQPEQQIDGSMITYFVTANENAASLSSLSTALAGRECFEATYYCYDKEPVYKYYFSTDANDCYIVDNNGAAYRMAAEDATKFIYSPYGIDMYTSSSVPVLSVGETTIYPASMQWQYLLPSGEYGNAITQLATSAETASVGGSLDPSFDVMPDYMQVQISDGDEVIYNDLYSGLSAVKFTDSGTLGVKIQAKWYDDSTRASYGEGYYEFNIEVSAPASFTLGTNTIQHGDFVVITGKNVKEGAEISFSSSPDIGFTPQFFRDGDNVYALVPISYDVEYSATEQFTIDCDGSSSTLTLNVTEKTYRTQNYGISVDLISKYFDGNAKAAYAEGMAPYYANKESTRYFEGALGYPSSSISNLNTVKTGYGVWRTLTATGGQYRNDGVDFIIGSSSSVNAAYAGKVIFAGEQTVTGKTVVIDHGWGLKSVYAHLSSISVSEGDTVEKDQDLGVVGSTGFTDQVLLHFGLFVFDKPVCPYNYYDSEIPIAN